MNSIYRDQAARFLPYLTGPQVKEIADKEEAVVVLPIGSIEQHGPHLPVYTDSILPLETLNMALSRLPDDFPAWFLPVVPYGKSIEHLVPYGKSNEYAERAGTFTLSTETFLQVLMEIGRSVARNGFKRLLILNGHGGNVEVMELAIRDLREETGLYAFGLSTFALARSLPPAPDWSEDEALLGIHAGAGETSKVLHICPELVHMDLAPDSLPRHLTRFIESPFRGPLSFGWMIGDLTSTGVVGNAKMADAERGELVLSHGADELADLIRTISVFEFEPHEEAGK